MSIEPLTGVSGMADSPEDAVFVAVSDGIEAADSEEEDGETPWPSSESGRDGILGRSVALIPSPIIAPGCVGELACLGLRCDADDTALPFAESNGLWVPFDRLTLVLPLPFAGA